MAKRFQSLIILALSLNVGGTHSSESTDRKTDLLVPSNTPSGITIGIATTLALIGIQQYHQRYIKVTPEIMEASRDFLEKLMSDPLFLYKEAMDDPQKINVLFQSLVMQKVRLIRAFGAVKSVLNPSTYISKDATKHLELINKLFDELEKMLKLDIKDADTKNNLMVRIRDASIDTYAALLKQLYHYKPEVLAEMRKKAIEDHEYLVDPDILHGNIKKIFIAFEGIKENPALFKCVSACTPNTVREKINDINNIENNIIYGLFGNRIYQYFTLNADKQADITHIKSLFELIRKSVVSSSEDEYASIKRLAIEGEGIVLKYAPERTQWDVIEHYFRFEKTRGHDRWE